MSKRLRSTLPIALVLCLLAAPFALRAGSQDTTSESPISPTSPLLPVRTVRVAMQDTFEVEARLAGRLVARRASELGFERSGRLVSVAVDEGARVAVGDLLAEFDTRELRAQQRELRARVEASDARLDLARATAKRRTDLHAAEYLSSQGLDEAVSNERAAVAQLAAERAALERVEVALELSELRAPYAAIVTARSADEGTVVSPGQTVLRVLEDGVQEVRIGVPPGLAASLVVGESYGVEIEGRAERARLRSVLPALDAATRTQTAIFETGGSAVTSPDGALAHLVFGRAVPARGCWLPMGALAEGRRGIWTAYALVGDETNGFTVERRQVEVIHAEAERAFVRGTLGDGDTLVADGVHRLVPGLRVRVTGPDASVAARSPGSV